LEEVQRDVGYLLEQGLNPPPTGAPPAVPAVGEIAEAISAETMDGAATSQTAP
jgi:hypothetical protein